MANLPAETIDTVFYLQRRLWKLINEATEASWLILERYGETTVTLSSLEEIDNSRERVISSYSRLYNLMLRIGEAQPMADSATLNLLVATIAQSQAIITAVEASIQEAKSDFDII